MPLARFRWAWSALCVSSLGASVPARGELPELVLLTSTQVQGQQGTANLADFVDPYAFTSRG